MPPALVYYTSEQEYRDHYERCYCSAVIYTFDGLRVYFPRHQFDDAFFESANRRVRDKSLLSQQRAERIDWIRAALENPGAELFAGWDRDRKRINRVRRVALVWNDYVVILNIQGKKRKAVFVTAYIADARTVAKIRNGPRWENQGQKNGRCLILAQRPKPL